MEKYYESINNIRESIINRRKDEILSEEIRKFFISEIGTNPPEIISGSYCVLAKHLFSATKEVIFAKALSENIGFKLVVPTFKNDRFVTCSKEKVSYVMPQFDGNEKPIELISGKERAEYDKRKASLSDIILPNGQDLFSYHYDLAHQCFWRFNCNV